MASSNREILPHLRPRWERKDFDFFLSFNVKDKEAVLKIDGYLQRRGVLCWVFLSELRAGRNWVMDLGSALRQSAGLVAVLGPGGLGPWQSQEVAAFLPKAVKDARKPLIPIQLPGFQEEMFQEHDLLQFLQGRQGPILTCWEDLSPLERLVPDCCEQFCAMSIPGIGPGGGDGGAILAASSAGLLDLLARTDLPGLVIQRLARLALGAIWWTPPDTGLTGTVLHLATAPDRDGVPPLLVFASLCRRFLGEGPQKEIDRWLEEQVRIRGLDLGKVQSAAREVENRRAQVEGEALPRVQVVVEPWMDASRGAGDQVGWNVRSHLRIGTGAKEEPESLELDVKVLDEEDLRAYVISLLRDVVRLFRINPHGPPRFPQVQLFLPTELLDSAFEQEAFQGSLAVRQFFPVFVAPIDRHRDFEASALEAATRFAALRDGQGPPVVDCRSSIGPVPDPDQFFESLWDGSAHALRVSALEFQTAKGKVRFRYFDKIVESPLPVVLWLRAVPEGVGGRFPAESGDSVLGWPEMVAAFRKGQGCALHRPGVAPTKELWQHAVLLWDDDVRPVTGQGMTGFCRS